MSEERGRLGALSVVEWVRERLDNCERHAGLRAGKDRDGWLEDAAYFREILAILAAHPTPPAMDDDAVIRDLAHALGPHASGCYTCKAAMKRNAARIAAALQRAAGEPHGQA